MVGLDSFTMNLVKETYYDLQKPFSQLLKRGYN
jgi:beta-mannanase